MLTGGSLEQALHLDRLCRESDANCKTEEEKKNLKKFIWSGVNGCFAFTFNDFGKSFDVFDTTGEQPKSYMISGITQVPNIFFHQDIKPLKDVKGAVSIPDDKESASRIELEDNTLVMFNGVEGMIEVNNTPEHPQYFRMTKAGLYFKGNNINC